MSAKNLAFIRRALLRWYDKNKRDLPWRNTKDPYAIWIAEAMLQQTQVRTVVPYYEKFLKAFPSVEALARAPQQRVLRFWSGLGYYRRAANLQLAARQLVRRHEGKIPRAFHELRSLPGIGDYTAGAILSIAFQQRYPALDGNARRVLSRIFMPAGDVALRDRAAKLVSSLRPGEINQALMDLGAVICTPRKPACNACPVADRCSARSRGALPTLEPKRNRIIVRNVAWPLIIVRHRDKILLRRRNAEDLLARLWELPGEEAAQPRELKIALQRQLRDLSIKIATPRRIGEIRHSITYRRIRAPIYVLDYRAPVKSRLPAPHWRWIRRSELDSYPMSSMTRKALRVFDSHEKSFS